MELVAKPAVLFLDEPTSGLDATSSLQLVQALRATAEQGVTVAAVLHQPRWESGSASKSFSHRPPLFIADSVYKVERSARK